MKKFIFLFFLLFNFNIKVCAMDRCIENILECFIGLKGRRSGGDVFFPEEAIKKIDNNEINKQITPEKPKRKPGSLNDFFKNQSKD